MSLRFRLLLLFLVLTTRLLLGIHLVVATALGEDLLRALAGLVDFLVGLNDQSKLSVTSNRALPFLLRI